VTSLSRLKTYAEQVDKRLGELLPSASEAPELLHAAMRHSCLAPGKRLRPALVMACAEAIGAEPYAVLDAGCAVELVHCFSLIHDDLPALDNDDLRRGVPTCHKVFGEAIAILAGDALFALAFETLSRGPWSADCRVRAMQSLTRATGTLGLVGGETIDILSEGKPIEEATLKLIHERKTGSLIASSCEIGAILGDGSVEQSQALYRYGHAVGLAFQIADDILNETSTPEQLGKAAGSDRERGKATYPAIYGLEQSNKLALEIVDEGISLLSAVPNRDFLIGLAKYSVERLH